MLVAAFLVALACVLCTSAAFSFGGLASARGARARHCAPLRSTSTPTGAAAPAQAAYAAIIEQAKASLKSSGSSSKPSAQAFAGMMSEFLAEYASSNLEAGQPPELFQTNLFTFLKSVSQSIESPYAFQPFHQAIRAPFDYYKWGNDFLKPLIILKQSRLVGEENARRILELTEKGENVVIMSNHQTEADPQVLSVLLEQAGMASLAEKIVFVAGHKVTNDPVAIPFSMGRNLLCIHSKKHIKNPPEDMPRKQAQNLASMTAMAELFGAGGKVFWVAPSGGRDRPAPDSPDQDNFVVAPFDIKAVDMFKILAMQSGKPMHFFPMSMYTNKLVPPPKDVSSTLGETRSAKRGAVSVEFLRETDGLGGLKDKDFLADVQGAVEKSYAALVAWHKANA